MKSGYVYIITNEKEGILYIGVTSDLPKRIWEHKNTIDPLCFTAKYNCKKLVYYEVFDTIISAIEREKQLKNWHRDWKMGLINTTKSKLGGFIGNYNIKKEDPESSSGGRYFIRSFPLN